MSLMYFSDKYVLYLQPHLDFGLNLLGGDVMAIPGVYQYVQVLCLLGFKSAICFKVLYDEYWLWLDELSFNCTVNHQ